jgi:hypothetical protein
MGPGVSVRKRERAAGLGWFGCWADPVAGFFFVLVPFNFLFYDLFHNFNIWIPNAFKQILNFCKIQHYILKQ